MYLTYIEDSRKKSLERVLEVKEKRKKYAKGTSEYRCLTKLLALRVKSIRQYDKQLSRFR
ncbi:hypothetical protein JO84_gp069 [Aureococcus anophagefferens virus]|uniref:Uncharacterized protein n=1 Tax=Aureococcus anophagefferens virus TaxID=1474867 RepID=A0A076FG72_9VIRU|nr:hypothetical protein JO84_gp069 [Aureococcus anophagefferens virus]AII17050.1 hypothetical protein AaV_069 [Aureococcus anophagefferens virus]UOG94369.1 hypothetical protein MKD35_334 [Aureococcus anophagefferens virus]